MKRVLLLSTAVWLALPEVVQAHTIGEGSHHDGPESVGLKLIAYSPVYIPAITVLTKYRLD
ncbi:hypothetical protein EXS54_00205 [Patescibacteria group bacterium]|nr:hypothetical protein [Patescibacteria group bacterium]